MGIANNVYRDGPRIEMEGPREAWHNGIDGLQGMRGLQTTYVRVYVDCKQRIPCSKIRFSWRIMQHGRGSKIFMQLPQCKGAAKESATHFITPACNCTSRAHLLQLHQQRQKRCKDTDAVHEQKRGQLHTDLNRKEPCDGSATLE